MRHNFDDERRWTVETLFGDARRVAIEQNKNVRLDGGVLRKLDLERCRQRFAELVSRHVGVKTNGELDYGALMWSPRSWRHEQLAANDLVAYAIVRESADLGSGITGNECGHGHKMDAPSAVRQLGMAPQYGDAVPDCHQIAA